LNQVSGVDIMRYINKIRELKYYLKLIENDFYKLQNVAKKAPPFKAGMN